MPAGGIRHASAAVLVTTAFLASAARAETSNGNEFALYYSEAKTERERKALLDDAKGRPHFFRYLQIMELEDNRLSERPSVAITAFEPSSYMDVKFVVTKRVSLGKLGEDPPSEVGDALAVTGVVRGVEKNTILLQPVVVRHKDRLDPKRGKEMLYEVDPSATFYSYTGGKRAVSLTYKDRDLLQYRDTIMAQHGRDGWRRFLEEELAKRNAAREAAKAERKREP